MTAIIELAEPAAGGCLCGAVRFEATGTPLWVAYCHCASCRRHTASPISCYAGFETSKVRFLAAAPTTYGSSPGVTRGFCSGCGTPLTYASKRFPGELHLFTGTFDEPEKLESTRHVFWHERLRGFDVHDSLPRYGRDSSKPEAWGPQPVNRLLFLCAGNSARSILAEAIVNAGKFTFEGLPVVAQSAGSSPAGQVNPGALGLLQRLRIGTGELYSKSWDQFAGEGAPGFRWLITLCDRAASEACPIFSGAAERLHWSLPDPASGAASFEETWEELNQRILTLLS